MVTFDLDEMLFSFELELGNCRSAVGAIKVRPMVVDYGYFPAFNFRSDLLARESSHSLLFKLWPQTRDEKLCSYTLPLLPSVEGWHPPRPIAPSRLLPTIGMLLSTVPVDIFPADAYRMAHVRVQTH
ncbi:hypothetical protein D1007_41724 [Hordeum vulgare]|nr:hypothetical protein D1007_41724 [Hordeum vulgare]